MSALALDANQFQDEMHIELCYNVYSIKNQRISSNNYQSSSSSLMAGFASARLALDTNEIPVEDTENLI